jgi:hypothetical protein
LFPFIIFNRRVRKLLDRSQKLRNLVERKSEDERRVVGEWREEIRRMRERLSGRIGGNWDSVGNRCGRRGFRNRVREYQSRQSKMLVDLKVKAVEIRSEFKPPL